MRECGARTSNYETPVCVWGGEDRGCIHVKYSESNNGNGMRGTKNKCFEEK